ncbi:HTTM domain-containing protein [Novosphingobium sp. JCM 18896]|uniref:HTTM domain-containing protein n=1 Tax=Novosphingobium sp. JCM 18896 TaxID=2989731 RepID=UPI002223B7C8|nr:HTTM domain-containing protein [Novosphingobium sp. JCM 18896]MCW1428908.1 HTTM domain-containing protein [Novosphingobium sp. JCM 18896]
MTLDGAIQLTTAMMAAAFVQQSLEHLRPAARLEERLLFVPRLVLSLLLLAAGLGVAGLHPGWLTLALVANHLLILPFFNGPYNGGADRMSLLVLLCLAGAWNLPEPAWRELAFAYLGLQLLLSYFMAGWVKVVNPEWRSGRALRDVFLFSAYPAGENLRRWAERPGVLFAMGWAVIGFELAFPLAFLSQPTLIAGLAIAALFHGANACLFGLNRFFWIWICAYPSILWLQERVL